ncbi:hypothetical protein HUN08_12440 [Gordonia sp. X0973]|uniref:hypothetical protein n=1 Tax=Gordonia sp. X0973 TaxID=2742602 RepID=UPI000F545540|nr:hypothetical protein [Gordonia sp. X0973]QKT07904.1 hypothetical protein HUN08_12440 [Gordonia sp. X0973]
MIDAPSKYETSLSIYDSIFNGAGGIEMYRAWTIPELYPNHDQAPQPLFENWDEWEQATYA